MVRKRDIRQIDAIVKKLKLSRGQRWLLHREVTGRGYNFQEIEEIGREIKQDYPNK